VLIAIGYSHPAHGAAIAQLGWPWIAAAILPRMIAITEPAQTACSPAAMSDAVSR
jgi:hypothetical protein